jgi:cyanophycinase
MLTLLAALSLAAAPSTPTDATPSDPPPPRMKRWLTGDPADADVAPAGPGLILMGGGTEPDEAFHWWRPLVNGGDVVILRTSGEDGYNAYLYEQIGGVDSVETLRVDRRALAEDPYVAWRVRTAEGIFIAGGDQSTYLAAWKDTPLHEALAAAWARGAVIGGTSAGLAVLGDRVYSARRGSVVSAEATADPFHRKITFEDAFLALPPLAGWVTDTHFSERDRMGRLVAFVARTVVDGVADPAFGLGVDEGTALLVDGAGAGRVVGPGAVFAVRADGPVAGCRPGSPLSVEVSVATLRAGDAISLPAADTAAAWAPLTVGP